MSGQVVTVDDKQTWYVSDTDGLKNIKFLMSIELSATLQQSQKVKAAIHESSLGKFVLKTKDSTSWAIVLDGEITRYDMVEFDRGFWLIFQKIRSMPLWIIEFITNPTV